jgi:hypothetical protein
MWLLDVSSRYLEVCNLLGLCVHIHVCAQIYSKTLQIGGELPVRRDTGITGH